MALALILGTQGCIVVNVILVIVVKAARILPVVMVKPAVFVQMEESVWLTWIIPVGLSVCVGQGGLE